MSSRVPVEMSPRRSRTRGWWAVIAAVLAATSVAGTPAPAGAAETGTIAGVIVADSTAGVDVRPQVTLEWAGRPPGASRPR